ncbi:MAG: gliding motility-associated C-terminal domain-containing protein [Flavobacteriales bacterium]|nr:gliding motility-associated C-terminal domain-containing protein [Flavobacteriales bacterium]
MKRLFYIVSFLFFCNIGLSQEICDNGIDDDVDGLIDLNDTSDCSCQIGVLPPIIPNPSFESYSACPTFNSQMSKVNFWQDALLQNSPDYFNCGYRITLIPFPFPHGTGAVGFAVGNGNAKEYIGTCLLDTLHAGVTYNLQFDYAQAASISPRPIAIFGTSNCANLPYPRTPVGMFGSTTNCPSFDTNWITLDTLVPIINNGAWNRYTFTFTPTIDVTSIVIGPSCALLSSSASQAFYGAIDDLKLSQVSASVTISDTGHYCRNNLVLTANYDSIPNSFQWYKNGIALVNDTTSSYSVPPYGIGSYQVLLNYNQGCLLSSFYKVDSVTINFDYDTLGSCINSQTGEINIKNMNGGTVPYQFNIDLLPFKLDSTFTTLSPGYYAITLRDSNLCITTKSINIPEFPTPISDFVSDTVCIGLPTTLTDKSFINKGIISNWNWGKPVNSSNQNSTFTFPNSGAFPITLTSISNLGCVHDTTINVDVNPLPTIDFNHNPITVYTFDTKVCFTNSSVGAISYLWDFDFIGPSGSSTINSPCPIIFPDNEENTYSVKLIGINQFGCVDSMIKNLVIQEDFIVYIPNSFTPDGDDLNDIISINHQGIVSLKWSIFNRWGEEVFFSSELESSWDGTYKGEQVPVGSYSYKLVVRSVNGEAQEIFGHINVIR